MKAAFVETAGADGRHISMCRVCEAGCGIVVDVENNVITKVQGDPDDPSSRGHLCVKAAGMAEITADPDRVRQPLRRTGKPGEFEAISWPEALDDIGRRLRAIIAAHGPEAVAMYFGNPGAANMSGLGWAKGFLESFGSKQFYSAASQDTSARAAACYHLYGGCYTWPFPDLLRTDFLLMLGANPLVSKGSLISAPRMKDDMDDIVARGGRVVVIDPRRTETARRYEHVPIQANSDAWLLGALFAIIWANGWIDRGFIDAHVDGADRFAATFDGFDLDRAATETGIARSTMEAMAHDFAHADKAAVYGRLGTARGSYASLCSYLIEALNIVTGRLDRPGGHVFGSSPTELKEAAEAIGLNTYGTSRTRIGNLPDVGGVRPSTMIAKEITTPGPGQIRAFFTMAGNPVLSSPAGDELADAMEQLELMISLELYVTETSRHAHYILPATTFYEREDLPAAASYMVRPTLKIAPAVVKPPAGVREEWWVFDQLARRIGVGGPFRAPLLRRLNRLFTITPTALVDMSLRMSPAGDRFGFRKGGLSMKRLRQNRHGIPLSEHIPTGVIAHQIGHTDGRVHLGDELYVEEMRRLRRSPPGGGYGAGEYRLIGRRELRSMNSWMHNASRLIRSHPRPTLMMNPADARHEGLADGTLVEIRSKSGRIEAQVELAADLIAGTVSYPHGFSHNGGWNRANAFPGANVNLLASTDPDDIEQASGSSMLDGIAVTITSLIETA